MVVLIAGLGLVAVACGGAGTAASTSPSAAAGDGPASPSPSAPTSATPLPAPTVAGVIAFCKVAAAEEGGDADIYTVRPDGTGLTRLTEYPGWEEHPTWSPDGKHLAYARYPEGSTEGAEASVWVMDADGSGRRRLTSRGCCAPSWSADGTTIAFAGYRPASESWDIFVMDADGGDRTAVVSSAEEEGYPVWTPDGRIVFSRGDTALYAVDPEDGELERLLGDVHFGGYAVSPDGERLAYEDLLLEVSSQLTDAMVVRPMDGGAGQAVVLAPVSAYVQSDPVAVPAWRPDGDVLAVATYDRHSLMGSPLYVLRADGSDLSVVPGIDDAMDPAWRPE